MECRMDGRVALITGGSRGLGEDYIANIGKGIPIGRMGTAQEYTNLACFLASEAGSYVTGTAINLDGGACPVV